MSGLNVSGLDLIFGNPRSEWVTLFRETVEVDRLVFSLEKVLGKFTLLRGRLVKLGAHLYVDRLIAGVLIEVLEAEGPAPEMRPDIYPIESPRFS